MSKPTIPHDLLYQIGDHVQRAREADRDNAIALFKSLERMDSLTELRRHIQKVPLIDYYHVDFTKYLYEDMEDAIVSPGQKHYEDACTPVGFVMYIILHGDVPFVDIDDDLFAVKELLKVGSIPNSDVRGRCLEKIREANEYGDEDEAHVFEKILKLIKESEENKRRKQAEQRLAFNKVLSDRLGEASNAADAGNVIDVMRKISEALAVIPEKRVPKWVPRAQSKKKKKTKKKKRTR
jgi:hypothetical protein